MTSLEQARATVNALTFGTPEWEAAMQVVRDLVDAESAAIDFGSEAKGVRVLEMGNGESLRSGVFQERDGTFTAMTFTKSKNFKTLAGAKRWHAKMTGN